MLRECVKQVPSLKNINLPIATDREKSIINAIKTSVYCDDLHPFFLSSSKEDFECLLQEKRKIWDSLFKTYYYERN